MHRFQSLIERSIDPAKPGLRARAAAHAATSWSAQSRSSRTACTHAPDIEAWARVAEPTRRLRLALSELYAYYAESSDMLDHVLHDAGSVPALASYLAEEWDPLLNAIVETLSAGWHVRGAAARQLQALLRVAIDFPTWKTLTGPGGMSSQTAATTIATAVTCATAKP